MKINVVLVEPEIPSNTGNISRTCSVIGAALHVVRPLGFDISDKQVKRAGLDYWDELEIHEYDSFGEVLEKYPEGDFYFCSTKAKKTYSDMDYVNNGDRELFFVFGKETKGLPEDLLREHIEKCIRIPMRENKRSLNLSNSAAIIVYEALRQGGFEDLQTEGRFPDEV